jgi:hypothetical protein
MADLLIDNQSVPSTPAAGKAVVYIDSTTKKVGLVDDAGLVRGTLSRNAATASQGAGFASDTYVTNSGLLIPSCGMKAGQLYRWRITLSKTAAGTAATVLTVRIGSTQTTSDTSRLALTSSTAQTAAVAEGILYIEVGVRNVSATGVIAGGFGFAAAVGLGGGKDGVSSTFDNSALAGQYVGLSINGGASAAWTITHVDAELIG